MSNKKRLKRVLFNEYRQSRGWTISRFAREIGISRAPLANYLSGGAVRDHNEYAIDAYYTKNESDINTTAGVCA